MMLALEILKRLARTVLILLLVAIGSTALVRFAPGYLSDAREMDARYRTAAQAELSAEAARSQSLLHMLAAELRSLAHGDLGTSRQYDIPVLELILPRLAVTASLLIRATSLAWVLAICTSLLSSAARRTGLIWQAPTTLLLAVPTSALATLCLLADTGGPLLVMTLLLAARDYKFLHRLLHKTWREPHLLLARAQGIRGPRLLVAHILPAIRPELLALATLSLVTALSALVPVEVIFSVPGIGQLAWNAAMNRDLPVLLAVTILMALGVTFTSLICSQRGARQGEWKAA